LSETLSSHPDSAYAQAHTARGLRALALIQSSPVLLGTAPNQPHVVTVIETPVDEPKVAALPEPVLPISPPLPPVRIAAPVAEPVPLPLARPQVVASATQDIPVQGPKLASLPPPANSPILESHARTAVYDISAHTVYL